MVRLEAEVNLEKRTAMLTQLKSHKKTLMFNSHLCLIKKQPCLHIT